MQKREKSAIIRKISNKKYMLDQRTRVNAAIAYFLLGPLFLLTRPGNPLRNDFVISHARKSSINMLIATIIFTIIYLVRKFLYINIVGFSLYNIVISVFFIIFFGLQLLSAYSAYRGNVGNSEKLIENFTESGVRTSGYSEEEKIQITLGFLPIISAFIAERNPLPEIIIGRKVSHFLFFLLICAYVFFGNSFNILVFLLLICIILLFVTNAVWIFTKNEFLTLKLYNFIPTYHEFESKISALYSMTKEFLQVAFGKKKEKNFQSEYQIALAKHSEKIPPEEKFWTHPGIIAFPLVNFITLPSFFNKKFHEYQWNIAEGFLLSIFALIIIFVPFVTASFGYFLIFPIIALFVQAKTNTNIRAPITSIARNIFIFSYKAKQKIQNLQNKTEEQTLRLQTDSVTEKTSENIDAVMKNL